MIKRFRAEEVILTNGGKQALYNLMCCLVQEGDEVLIPEPYWVTFPDQVRISRRNSGFCTNEAGRTIPNQAEEIEKRITSRTRVLILNSPNNPSGAVIPRETMEEIVRLCARKNLQFVFDECYDCFVFPPHQTYFAV